MRLLVQRVSKASVSIAGEIVSHIDTGMLIMVGVGRQDSKAEARWLANKCAGLRIFQDRHGKTNLSLLDIGGAALVISQFTLYADTTKGRRPSFLNAELPEKAETLVQYFAERLTRHGILVNHGHFGEEMQVDLVNDGPMTIWIDRDPIT